MKELYCDTCESEKNAQECSTCYRVTCTECLQKESDYDTSCMDCQENKHVLKQNEWEEIVTLAEKVLAGAKEIQVGDLCRRIIRYTP